MKAIYVKEMCVYITYARRKLACNNQWSFPTLGGILHIGELSGYLNGYFTHVFQSLITVFSVGNTIYKAQH